MSSNDFNPEIYFTKQILNKTARELGFSQKTVAYAYQFFIDYLHKNIESTNCSAFYIPYLGVLYAKEKEITNQYFDKAAELEKDPDNTTVKKQKIALGHKRDLMRKFIMAMDRPLSQSNHHKTERFDRIITRRGWTPEKLQEFQNEIFERNKKKDDELMGNN